MTGTCDLCDTEDLELVEIPMPHLAAWRAWICEDCLAAVADVDEERNG